MTTTFIPARPAWATIGAFVGSFLGAIGIGSLLAWSVGAPGELAGGIAVFGQLFIFFVGYKLWVTYAIALFMGGVGGKLLGTVAAAVRRRDPEIRAAAKAALTELRDPQQFAGMLEKIRARTSVFRMIGIGFGALTGLAVGVLGARAGIFGSLAVFTGGGWCYGLRVRSQLARTRRISPAAGGVIVYRYL